MPDHQPDHQLDDQPHVHHAIDYVELGVVDLERAKAFYAAAFDWRFNDYGPGYASIRWTHGDAEVGGLNVGAPTGPGGALVLLYSDHLDSTVTAIEAAGGTIVEPPFAFPGGRRLVFDDLDGNRLGVWSSS